MRGVAIERNGELRAAALVVERENQTSVLQLAALEAEAAASVLLAASGGTSSIRLTNVPEGDPVSSAMHQLGARLLARQHELRLSL